ncbi:hypothetical protein P3T76_003697 [Phytophthora citrophthora]|uniref:Uncharacterized protein n=1 Tax=Phytophthora citrophthora TaxID=4793 RepID=A0AAD9GU78_9STRA|nr:hypothetical protein P3T76_003697 [Phytophthora citrophthora]
MVGMVISLVINHLLKTLRGRHGRQNLTMNLEVDMNTMMRSNKKASNKMGQCMIQKNQLGKVHVVLVTQVIDKKN